MNARAIAARSARLILMATVLAACQPSADAPPAESPIPTTGPTRPASAEPSLDPSPSSAPTTAPTSISPPPIGGLQVEGFAEVVADLLQMRHAPGLAADVLLEPFFGDYPPGTEFPPVTVGRDTPWTQVYVLAGPVEADGFDWYLAAQAEESAIWHGRIGWVASGDSEDAWLVPTTVPCPDDPVELADVTLMAMSRLRALYCLGGREITLRGYYTAPAPGEPLEGGECASEPAWLVCDFGTHMLRTVEAGWAGDANNLDLQLHPDLGPMPPRPGWIEVTGQFDHPAAEECGAEPLGIDLDCRTQFVVTSARAVE